MQGKKSVPRQRLDAWFERHQLQINIVAEFDDSALMKAFGQEGYGIFTAPTVMEQAVIDIYQVEVIARSEEIEDTYYAISPDKQLKHPAVLQIVNAAHQSWQAPGSQIIEKTWQQG